MGPIGIFLRRIHQWLSLQLRFRKNWKKVSNFLRRLNLLSVLILLTVSILFCALAPNYEWFLGGYFMIGFCLFGYETSIYIYIGEISGKMFFT